MGDSRRLREIAHGALSGDELALFADARCWHDYIAAVLDLYIGGRVLEVGAGIGNMTEILNDARFDSWRCLEPDARLASQLSQRMAEGALPGNYRVDQGDLRSLDASEQFDTILYIDVLEHIEADREELAAASRHLAPRGFLIVLSPAWQWLYTPFDFAIGHYRRYDQRSLRKLTPAGLRIEALFYLDSAGMVASLANRFLLRASMPTERQLQFWDRVLVPISKFFDRVVARRFGKSVVAVWTKADG